MILEESLRANFHPEIVYVWRFKARIAPNLNPSLGAKIAEMKVFADFREFEPLPRNLGVKPLKNFCLYEYRSKPDSIDTLQAFADQIRPIPDHKVSILR
jgi:hypothetical protein